MNTDEASRLEDRQLTVPDASGGVADYDAGVPVDDYDTPRSYRPENTCSPQ